MQLDDYAATAQPIDDTPRPKASQAVAAAKRRAMPTHDAPLAPTPDPRRSLPLAAGAVLIVLAMIGMASYGLGRGTTPLAITPTDAGASVGVLAAPTATIAPTIAPDTHVVSAYAAPDGVVLGPVDLDGEIVVAVARAGAGWVLLQRSSGDRVWFRRADLPANLAVPGTLPDLSPPAAIAPPTGRGLTDVQSSDWTPPEAIDAPVAAPEPTVTTAWPTSAPAKIPDFSQPDIRGTCQFVGCLGEKAVDLARAQTCTALYWQYGDVTDEDTDVPAEDMRQIRACVWEGLYL